MTVFIYDDSVAVSSPATKGEEVLQDAEGIDRIIEVLQARKAQIEREGF